MMSKKDELVRQRRRMQTVAVNYAIQGDWGNAIIANEDMLALDEKDVETLNRLAKAYYESGDVEAAKRTYALVLEYNELNPIARRALSVIDKTETQISKTRTYVEMRNFVIETGKSILTTIHIDQPEPLSLLPGEVVYMVIPGTKEVDPENKGEAKKSKSAKPKATDANALSAPHALLHFTLTTLDSIPSVEYALEEIPDDANAIDVYDCNNKKIGRLEPRVAQRIIRFMRIGNRYAAMVWRVSEHYHHVDLAVREVYHNPDHRGEVSFPGKLIDEDKAPLLDLADEEIEEGGLGSGYDEEEELPRLSSYDDDDEPFEAGDENNDDEDIDEFPGSKKAKPRSGPAPKQTYGEKEISLGDLAKDEAKHDTDVEEE
jgi:tetratricopeptide (TPR) repeat protein